MYTSQNSFFICPALLIMVNPKKLEIQLFIRTNAFEAKAFMTNKVNLIISFYFWLFCHLLHFDNLKFMSRIKQDRLRAVTGIFGRSLSFSSKWFWIKQEKIITPFCWRVTYNNWYHLKNVCTIVKAIYWKTFMQREWHLVLVKHANWFQSGSQNFRLKNKHRLSTALILNGWCV